VSYIEALLAASVLAVTPSTPAGAINVTAESTVYFSNPSAPDRLVATVAGPTCNDALFSISIRHSGTELYRREFPLRIIIPCDRAAREPLESTWWIAHVANEAVALRRAVNITCHQPRDVGCVESPEAAGIRAGTLPALCFATDLEGNECVSFDPVLQKVITIRRYQE
jgi:hypothetical protein